MSRLATILRDADPTRIVLLAPLIFALHVAEEAPGFVHWFNSLVRDGISQRLFLTVNASALLITVLLAVLTASTKGMGAVIATLGWLSFLVFANAIFHVVGTVALSRYSPGTITAATLYLLYFAWFLWVVIKRLELSPFAATLTVALGSLLMLIHGYLIVFKGRRLF